LGLGVAGWAVFNYTKANPQKITASTQKTSQDAITTPTSFPTPTSALSRNDLTVQILNGTGIPGVAGVLKDKLEGLGYSAVSTGNADNYDYKKVEISLKTSKAAYFDLLVSDLGVAYTIASSSGTLSTSSQFDAVIILGQQ
jgi:hypothetical protein